MNTSFHGGLWRTKQFLICRQKKLNLLFKVLTYGVKTSSTNWLHCQNQLLSSLPFTFYLICFTDVNYIHFIIVSLELLYNNS